MAPDETRDLPMLCGRSIQGNPKYFSSAEHHGEKVYFCTGFCERAYRAEPERFAVAHGKRKDKTQENG